MRWVVARHSCAIDEGELDSSWSHRGTVRLTAGHRGHRLRSGGASVLPDPDQGVWNRS